MLKEAVKIFMIRKYDKYRIYFHNFSYFDGVFMLRVLSKISNKISIKQRDGRIISISFKYLVGKNYYTLFFHDSLLILPQSLDKLAKSFEVENKARFPILFLNNTSINLDYKGLVPELKYFVKTSEKE
jgi:hypothetical protein